MVSDVSILENGRLGQEGVAREERSMVCFMASGQPATETCFLEVFVFICL